MFEFVANGETLSFRQRDMRVHLPNDLAVTFVFVRKVYFDTAQKRSVVDASNALDQFRFQSFDRYVPQLPLLNAPCAWQDCERPRWKLN
jgi:hypothetical protein